MSREELAELFNYSRWATERLLAALEALSEEQYSRNLGSSFGGVRDTLIHMYGAEWIWLERWRGQGPQTFPSVQEIPTLELLKSRWSVLHGELQEFVAALDEERLQADFSYRDMKGNQYTQPLWQQLQHLVNHSTYHRGQIASFMRQLGAKPAGTDLIYYYRQ